MDRAVARLLPPESAALELVAQKVGHKLSGATALARRAAAKARPWAGLDFTGEDASSGHHCAVLPVTGKNAWCREQGVYPAELDKWCSCATAALADPHDARPCLQATHQHCKRIKALERELLRKDRALAKTAELPTLSKKYRRSSAGERTNDHPRRSSQFGP